MMRFALLCCVIAAMTTFSMPGAFAVGPGKVIEWDAPSSPGKVSLDGNIHAEKGLKCMECHTKIWPMKKGTTMKMDEMNAGKYCGVCHNGNKTFSTRGNSDCTKCHQSK
ncbi:MAG TPA: c(7)-type cytochrome triheme domain-containing protein [Dissulfurispiraceae bacterium]|nr:c(7)-type cytochrome triheme domain-containing protein [Dissulfurispiraceae bacterium]